MTKLNNQSPQITIYETPDGKIRIDVIFENNNIWLNQKLIAQLFETTTQNITQHLQQIYKDQEIDEKATCKDFLQVQKEGDREVKRTTKIYSLEAIIAV
jgi:hypothetical protein